MNFEQKIDQVGKWKYGSKHDGMWHVAIVMNENIIMEFDVVFIAIYSGIKIRWRVINRNMIWCDIEKNPNKLIIVKCW